MFFKTHTTLAILLLSFSPLTYAIDSLYYANTDNSVIGINIDTQEQVSSISSNNFRGAAVGAGREFAIDPDTRLLWYSSTDNSIYSINIDTLVEGPSILSNQISGAAVGAERHLFIDYSRRYLMLTTTSGDIQRFNIDTLADVDSIPSTFFTDGNVGTFRHLASDIRSGTIWYAATDGSFREFNPDSLTLTGRTISFGEQIGANPGAFRHFVIDPNRDLFLYAVTDGSIATVPLSTLKRGETIVGSNAFSGANPGAGRIISYDIEGIAGGSNEHAAFVSNYLILPFVDLGNNSVFSATLFFDSLNDHFSVVNAEETIQTLPVNATTTYNATTGIVNIPAVDFNGVTYNATLNQINGSLDFSLGSVSEVE